MIRKVGFLMLLLLPLVLQPLNIGANMQIRNLQKGGKMVHNVSKNGQQVNNCTYCHTGTPIKQVPGLKQNYRKGQANFNSLRNLPKCAGSGCHN